MSTSSNTVNPVRKHNRDIWLKIVAPILLPLVALIGLCVALIVAVATDALERQQVSIIMGIVSTLCLTLPLSLLCMVGVLATVALAYAGGLGYRHVRSPLRALRRLTERIKTITQTNAPKIAAPTTTLNTRITRIEHTLRGWLFLPEEKETNDE